MCKAILFYTLPLWDKNDNSPGIDILYENFQKKIYECSQTMVLAVFFFSNKWRLFPKKKKLFPKKYSTKSSLRIVTFSITGWQEHFESQRSLLQAKQEKFFMSVKRFCSQSHLQSIFQMHWKQYLSMAAQVHDNRRYQSFRQT